MSWPQGHCLGTRAFQARLLYLVGRNGPWWPCSGPWSHPCSPQGSFSLLIAPALSVILSFTFFITFIYLVCPHVPHIWRPEDNLQELVLFSYHVGPRNQTQVTSGKHLTHRAFPPAPACHSGLFLFWNAVPASSLDRACVAVKLVLVQLAMQKDYVMKVI